MTTNDIRMMAARLKGWNKQNVALELVKVVQAIYEPKSGWTLDSGRECIEVLLIAARYAYPTACNVQELIERVEGRKLDKKLVSNVGRILDDKQESVDPPITAVGRNLAEQIEEIKKELEDGQD